MAPRAALADALSTALCIMAPTAGRDMIAGLKGVRATGFERNGVQQIFAGKLSSS